MSFSLRTELTLQSRDDARRDSALVSVVRKRWHYVGTNLCLSLKANYSAGSELRVSTTLQEGTLRSFPRVLVRDANLSVSDGTWFPAFRSIDTLKDRQTDRPKVSPGPAFTSVLARDPAQCRRPLHCTSSPLAKSYYISRIACLACGNGDHRTARERRWRRILPPRQPHRITSLRTTSSSISRNPCGSSSHFLACLCSNGAATVETSSVLEYDRSGYDLSLQL